MRGKQKRRTAIIGLDGLGNQSFDIFSNSIQHLKVLINKSLVKQNLRALEPVPPITYPSWTSILTGVNPGKHGIPGFLDANLNIMSTRYLERPRLFEDYSIIGGKSIVVNPMPDHPLFRFPRVHYVSFGFFSPKIVTTSETMSSIFKKIDIKSKPKDSGCTVSKELISFYELYYILLEEIIENKHTEHDLLWFLIDFPDGLLHNCSDYMLSSEKLIEKTRPLLNIIDKILSKILEHYDIVILVSDHGFSTYSNVLYVNNILYNHRFIELTENAKEGLGEFTPAFMHGNQSRTTIRKITIPYELVEFSDKIHLRKIIKNILNKLMPRLSIKLERKKYYIKGTSLAFYYSLGLPGVIVKDNKLIDEVIRALNDCCKELISVLKPRSKYAWGPYLNRLPHVIVQPNYFKKIVFSHEATKRPLIETRNFGWHHPDGVFYVKDDTNIVQDLLIDLIDMNGKLYLQPYTVGNLMRKILGIPLHHDADLDRNDIFTKLFSSYKKVNNITKWKLAKKIGYTNTKEIYNFA